MEAIESYTRGQTGGISALCTFFITYPNMMWVPWNMSHIDSGSETQFWVTFVFRCLFFFALFYAQIRLNLTSLAARSFITRFGKNLLFTISAGIIFTAFSYLIPILGIQSATVGKHLTFQFLVVSLLCTFIGYISELNTIRNRKEREIERLKMENLQSRYDSLMDQINPHFFFNSLNGISSLVMRADVDRTLHYITRLSDIFRYTLRNDRRQLATVEEELAFARAFADVMGVRYGGKLIVDIDIPEEYIRRELPVFSLLPLLENATVHNRIDSGHIMTVRIRVEEGCLIVTNNIYPKLIRPDTNGTGLKNLGRRYELMINKNIKITDDGTLFKVSLPLKSV